MKILKTILFGIIAVIALLLIVGLFTKKDYAVERSITINKPKHEVFNYVKYLKNQNEYSKWASMDPQMKKEFRGTDGTPGFVSAWESKNDDVGKGEQTIVKIEEGKSINYDLHFIEPFDGRADAVMSTEAKGDTATEVKWSFSSKTPYPMNVMLLFMDMEKMIGDDLQIGLNNLKAKLENNQTSASKASY